MVNVSNKSNLLQKLSGYYVDILKYIRSTSTPFLKDITQGRSHAYVDLSFLTESESILLNEDSEIIITPPKTENDLQDEELLNKQTAFVHLRELEQRYKINPYEREFLYAYPFITGKDKDGKNICTPLFTVKSDVDYDLTNGQIKISLTRDPEINTYILKSLLDEAQFKYLQKNLLAKGIPSIPIVEGEFLLFLRSIVNIAPSIFEPIDSWDWKLNQISRKTDEKMQIISYSALLLVGRTDYYLRDNLEDLQTSIKDFSGSVLTSFFTSEIITPQENDNNQKNTEFEELIFPFESNLYQNNIAKNIETHNLITVQGPPGTGKSQTISNLICHLVSQGKTVLLTSQKNQALKVVVEKWLEKLNIDYLFLSLLKDDSKSKQELLKLLDALDAYINEECSLFNNLDKQHEELNQKLNNIRSEIRDLKSKFEIARKREHEHYQQYEKFHKTRKDDIIPEEIRLPNIETSMLTDDVFNYGKNYIDGGLGFVRDIWYNFLNKWSSKYPQFIENANKNAMSIMEVAKKMEQIASLLEDEKIVAIQKALLEDETFRSHSVSTLLEWINEAQPIIIEFLEQKEKFKRQSENWELLLISAKEIAELDDKIRKVMSSNIDTLPELTEKMLQNFPIKWYQLFRRFRYRRYSNKFDEICTRLSFFKELSNLNDAKKKRDIYKLQNELSKLRIILEFADLIHQIKLILGKQTFQILEFSEFEDKTISEFYELLRIKIGALQLISLINEIKDMPSNIKFIADAYEINNLLEQREPSIIKQKCASLKSVARSIPYFVKLKEIENKIGNVANWVRNYCDKEKLTGLDNRHWDVFKRTIIAHRLYEFFEENLNKNPEDTCTIVWQLTKLRKKEKEIIKKLLEINVKKNLKSKYSVKVRQNIAVLKKALKTGKKKFVRFEQLKEQIDFKEILKVLPCWIMSIDDVCRILPLEPGLFDVLIVDEASQCHLMGALPLLYRAKKAIVVGDKKQLPNADLMFLDSGINDEKKRVYGIESLPRGIFFDVANNSLIDLAEIWQDIPQSLLLKEHYRCLPEIINFCNQKFYGWLQIMTHSLDIPPDGIFEIRKIDGAFEENKVNKLEAEELINDVFKRLKDKRYDKLSFGILSPFREQADYLEMLLEKKLLEEPVLRTRFDEEPIICDSFDGFQGNERDVIFYSFRYAPNSHPGIFAIERGKEEMGEKRMNVAFSRPRKKVVCYISNDIEKFPKGTIRDFLTYIKSLSVKSLPSCEYLKDEEIDKIYEELEKKGRKVSEFEKDVFKRLNKRGYLLIPQYETCGFYIDIVMGDNFGRRIAIECDGGFHYEEGDLRIEDSIRQEILERVGWHVYRIPSRKYWHNPDKCINDIIEQFEKITPTNNGQLYSLKTNP